MVISILFFFVCILFAIAYYFYVQSLKQQACYFIDCLYRCNATFYYLMIKFSLRSVLKGCIHFYLHSNFFIEMLSLAGVEGMVLVATLLMELKWEIFISKVMFHTYLLYHSLYCLLNLSFAWESHLGQKLQLIEKPYQNAQKMLIYMMMASVCLIVIYGLIPLDKIKPKKKESR